MSLFAAGVTVVSTRDTRGSTYGVTVSAFASLSLNPPLVLACLDNRTSGLDHFLPGGNFAVSILSAEQAPISTHFATAGTDRSLAGGYFEVSESGQPFIKECLAWMECELRRAVPAGDHTILIGEVVALHEHGGASEEQPLVYFRKRYWCVSELPGFPLPSTGKPVRSSS